MPCAAGELCLVLARTPKRPDGHECRGKCGGRLHGLCGEADQDCDNPMQRVCHDCLATKRSSKGKDVTEATKFDAADEMTEALQGTHVNKVNAEGIEDSHDDTPGHGGGDPPAYVDLLSHSVSLESAAEACGNGDASFYLRKARMLFIKAHASKPVQQADMRSLCEPQQGGTADDCSAVQQSVQ